MIELDKALHIYRVDGVVTPGVTTVIREASLIDGEEWFTKESRDKGAAVHAATHYADEGDLDQDWLSRTGYAGYVAAWARFKAEADFKPELIEHLVHSPIGYCGTVDRTGVLGHCSYPNALVDIKSGVRSRWHAVQTAAYAGTFREPRRFRRMTVYLRADQSYDVREHPAGEYAEDFGVFLAALKLWNWREIGNTGNSHRAAA